MDSGMPRRGMLQFLPHGEFDSEDEHQQQQVELYGPTSGPESLHSSMDTGYPRHGMVDLLLNGEFDSNNEQQQEQEQQQAMLFGAALGPIPSSDELQQDQAHEQQQPNGSQELYKVGMISLMVVEVDKFSRKVSEWEKVILARSPIPGDKGILVLTHCHQQQVGYVESRAGAILAPLIDSQVVSMSSVVPSPGYTQGMLEVPCYVHIYSCFDDLRMVREALCRPRLTFFSSHSSEQFIEPVPGCIFPRPVDSAFDRLRERLSRKPDALPLEPPSDVITAELFPHQKEALGWLVEREGSSDLPPFWFEKNGFYVNELSGLVNDNGRPEPVRGGIFADECGSGKRLTLISLMALDKCIRSPWVCDNRNSDEEYEFDEEQMEEGEYKDPEQPWNNFPGDQMPCFSKRPRTDTGLRLVVGRRGAPSIRKRATLVICEPTALRTWESQIKRHTREESMSVYLYYGRRTSSVEEVKSFDVVLTTYRTLAAELRRMSPISDVRWWRVILDGADSLNRNSLITNLTADRRWAVINCPINNVDIFKLLSFVRLHPFYLTRYWTQFIGNPLRTGNPAAVSRLQVILESVALIRTKETLNEAGVLPPLVFETRFVELSLRERENYELGECAVKCIVENFLTNPSSVFNHTYVLSLILRLRKICSHTSLSRSDIHSLSDIQDVSNRPELLEKLVGVLQETEDMECPICICPPVDAVITICAHVFCRDCIIKTMKELNSLCPMCRGHLTEADLFAPKPDKEAVWLSSLPSKAKQLMKLLEESRVENPNGKSVVFSQFQTILGSLEQPLTEAGYKVFKVEGSKSISSRSDVVKLFDDMEGPSVLLASLKKYGAGMELTAASNVYLLEPWWNPLMEKQAIDRVHRVGQKLPVRVVRLVVSDTIEERVLLLQANNREADQGQLGGRPSRYNRNLKDHELRLLMGL